MGLESFLFAWDLFCLDEVVDHSTAVVVNLFAGAGPQGNISVIRGTPAQ